MNSSQFKKCPRDILRRAFIAWAYNGCELPVLADLGHLCLRRKCKQGAAGDRSLTSRPRSPGLDNRWLLPRHPRSGSTRRVFQRVVIRAHFSDSHLRESNRRPTEYPQSG